MTRGFEPENRRTSVWEQQRSAKIRPTFVWETWIRNQARLRGVENGPRAFRIPQCKMKTSKLFRKVYPEKTLVGKPAEIASR